MPSPLCLPLLTVPLQALPNRPAVIVMDAYSFVRGAVGSYLKVRLLLVPGGHVPALL